MRWTLLAALTVLACASPALAQLRSHRAVYQPRVNQGAYQFTARTQTHVSATIAEHGHGEYGDGSGGCACGHPPRMGRNCCPGIFPDLIDNIEDAFICLIPTRAHCCPYPKVCVPTKVYTPPTCTSGCQPSLLSRLFPGNKSCCNSGCSSCTTKTVGCGCTAKAGIEEEYELLTPPKAPAASPFNDDPIDPPAVRGTNLNSKGTAPKTTSTSPGWYKTVRPEAATTIPTSRPGVIAVGNASPIRLTE